jgi:regulator of cell morphogenesis and NO signaling
MTPCDLDRPVPEWVVGHPETLPVFREWGVDDSCGGKSLAYACRERGPDAAVVLARLLRCVGDEEQPRRGRFTEGG